MPRETTVNCDYIQKSSMGNQAESTKHNVPSYGFGTSSRNHEVYLL